MGFGLSGSDSSTLMFGADATITWVDSSSQPNAVDYHLSDYTQVHTHTHTHTHAYTHTRIHTHTQAYTHTHAHTFT